MLPKVLIALVVLALLFVAGFIYKGTTEYKQFLRSGDSATNASQTSDVTWETDKDGWKPSSKPSDCPSPLILQIPVDLSLVTTILYPGQTRGGDYKAHGGFRFDSSKNDAITVKAPMDAVISDASRYIEQGEVQYMFDFVNPCGIRYRFDHLLVLEPKFAKIVEELPAAKVDDSRTTRVNPPESVSKGEVITTAVGLRKSSNVFVDFGVYDMRSKNKSSQDPNWARQHYLLAHYGICWFNLLTPEDAAKVKSLPAGDSISGSKSDFCKP